MYSLSIENIQKLLIEENLLREVIVGKDLHYRITDQAKLQTQLTSLSYHSATCDDNTLFFCKGNHFKATYLEEAVTNGVSVYLSEQPYPTDHASGFIVSDIRKAMAVLSRAFYAYPDERLTLVGITGTKGKTTTTFLLYNILANAYPGKVGYSSTINNFYDGIHHERANLTTPESVDLFRMFAIAVEKGLEYFVMEVSSQAYKLERVYGILFDYGVFLNFSPDHISKHEHPTLEDYLFCKRQLLRNSKHAVIYSGTAYFDLLLAEANEQADTVTNYGEASNSQIIVNLNSDNSQAFGLENTATQQTDRYPLKLTGDFNKLNASAATIIARDLGITKETIAQALQTTTVPGRMETLKLENDVSVVIDFAHNALSMHTLLDYLRTAYPEHRLISVVGGPGSRGEERLLGIAKVLSKQSDIVYLTSDNPDYDEPADLAHLISDHITSSEAIIIEENREKAITQALASSTPGDVIAIMGKGSEDYQIIKGEKQPYIGDKQVVEKFIAQP